MLKLIQFFCGLCLGPMLLHISQPWPTDQLLPDDSQMPWPHAVVSLATGIIFYQLPIWELAQWPELIFLNSLLIMALMDYQTQSFEARWLIPAVLTASYQFLLAPKWTELEWLLWLPIMLFLLGAHWLNQLGGGDIWIYGLLALFYGPLVANQLLLLAACLLIFTTVWHPHDATRHYPLLPFLYLAVLVQHLSH